MATATWLILVAVWSGAWTSTRRNLWRHDQSRWPWLAPERKVNSTSDRSANQFGFDVRAGFASDYMYRGTTLSDHKPAVGAAMEATFAQFYAGVSVASVKLPTQPAAEIAVSGGVRQKIGDIDFDLRATYFLYPGETSVGTTNGIDYWEAAIRADKRITELDPCRRRFRLFAERLQYRRLELVRGRWFGLRRPEQSAAGRTSAYRSPEAPATPGSAISLRSLAAFRCPPISIGRPASRSHARFSTSTCATTTPICRRKTASSLPETPTQGRAAASIPSRTRKA